MSIELDPPELGFRRPFTREVVQTLRIRNTNYDPVAFKVKTTAPKQYCVRPNSGRIEAGKEVEVQVLLQAMKEDPPPDFKCRDKFLVQSVLITAEKEASNVQQIWSHIEKTNKSAIQEKKIRVTFLQPDEDMNGNNQFDSSPPPYAPLSAEDASSAFPASVGPISKPDSKPSGYSSTAEAVRSAGVPGTEDLAMQLADAHAKIARLEAELKEKGGVRRTSAGVATDAKERVAAGAAGMGTMTHPPEGIPVQICAALCLAAFLIAWFFF